MKKVTLILISLLLCLCLVGCDGDHDDVVDNDVDDVVEVKNTITPLEDKKITGYTSYDIVPYKLNVDEGASITFRFNTYENGEWTSEDWVMDTADDDSLIFGFGVNTYPELKLDDLPTTLIYYRFDDDLGVTTKVASPIPITFKDINGSLNSWLQNDRNIVDGEELVVLAMFGTSGNMLTPPGRDVFDDNYKNGDWVYDKAIVITLIVTYKE